MANPVIEIIITKNNSYATGMYFDDGSIRINKGSKVSPFVTPNASKSVVEWRKRIENEALDSKGLFSRDFIFPDCLSCVSAIVGKDEDANAIDTVNNVSLADFLGENVERGPLCFSVTCRPDAYDVEGAFRELDSIWWRQSLSQIRKGDIVFIYVARPIQAYIYKCLVLNANVSEEKADLAKDAKFILDISVLPDKRNYMELKLIEKGNLPVSFIAEETEFDIYWTRKQFLLSDNLVDVFDKYFIQQPSLADLDDNEPVEYYYSDTSEPSAPRKINSSTSRYVRSAFEKQKALNLSNGKCQMPGCCHELFVNKNGEPYLEVHHIIPMNAQGNFESNIDIADNMVCLCPSCHREVHHGKNAKEKVLSLYKTRREILSEKGISVDEDELLEFYGIK